MCIVGLSACKIVEVHILLTAEISEIKDVKKIVDIQAKVSFLSFLQVLILNLTNLILKTPSSAICEG